MRLKLDENLGRESWEILRQSGHDVATVHGPGLGGTPDGDLIMLCREEGRGLVTLDLDFANPLLFKPSQYEGIAVIRLPRKPSPTDLIDAARTLAGALGAGSFKGKLWIIQKGRIREHQEET